MHSNGCEIWSTGGEGGTPYADWAQVNTNGFGSNANYSAPSMAEFGDSLLVGTVNTSTGCEVWSWDGSAWKKPAGSGFRDSMNWRAAAMAAHEGRLYVGTYQSFWGGGTGCEVWSTAGAGGHPFTDWAQEGSDGFGSSRNESASCMAPYFSSLFLSMENHYEGCSVWNTGSTWYLAEGASDGGFETWVLVQNPGTDPAHVDFTLNTDGGEVNPPELQGVEIPAGSRRSFNLGRYVTTFNVSTKVRSTDGLVICERAMYWTPLGQGFRDLGHDSIGYSP